MNVIIKPIVTEKSMSTVSNGRYTFAVAKDASKLVIKAAVAKMFSVTVTSVATSTIKGKKKRFGAKRQEVAIADWKKAIVTVKKGDRIALFEPETEEKKKK
mgnify:CR=1 FL=1